MKNMHTKTLLVAGLAFASPAFLAAQTPATPPSSSSENATKEMKKSARDLDKKWDDTKNKADKALNKATDRVESALNSGSGAAEFRRVSKDSIENQTTAKDMIGQAVYGNDGEKLGDIADLTLGSDFASASTASTSTAGRASSGVASTYGNPNSSDTGILNNTPGSTSTASTADRSKHNTPGSTSTASTADHSKHLGTDTDSSWSSAKSMTGSSEPHAIISVGGLMGIGNDLVSVPLSSLKYDAAEERYTLNVSKTAFVAVAEDKDASK